MYKQKYKKKHSRNTKDLVNTTSNYIFVNPKGKLVINGIKSF